MNTILNTAKIGTLNNEIELGWNAMPSFGEDAPLGWNAMPSFSAQATDSTLGWNAMSAPQAPTSTFWSAVANA